MGLEGGIRCRKIHTIGLDTRCHIDLGLVVLTAVITTRAGSLEEGWNL